MTVEKRRRDKTTASRIAVLVLGMHRSGTSALSRVLNLLGCDLPKTLMGTTAANEMGHWESTPVAHLNDEILASAGSNWHDWLAINPGWSTSPKAAEFKEEALAVLEDQFGTSRLFVLKDPRICRLTPFWLDVLREGNVQPAIVMPVRNPLEVAESLASRDGIDPALGQLLWLRHVLEAEAGSRGLIRYHASYDALMANWPKMAISMQERLGISWPRLSPMASEEIDAFLTKRLRHHQEAPARVSDNPLLSAWLRDSFEVFGRWANAGENAADFGTLDRIRNELDSAAPAFARLVTAGERASAKARQLDANLKEAKEKLSQSETAAAAQQSQVEELERRLTEANAALTASHASSEQKHQQIGEMAARLAEAQLALTKLQEEAQSSRTAAAEALGELSHVQSALAQRSAEADDVNAQLRLATDSLVEEKSAREKEAELAERLGKELEAERGRAAANDERIVALTRLLKEKEAGLAERFNEIAVMTRLLADRESAVVASNERIEWLRQVSGFLLNNSRSHSLKGRLAALMPASVRLNKQKERLKRSGIFDPGAYLAANPDVAEAGMDPLRHYIEHGIAEGRRLILDSEISETQG